MHDAVCSGLIEVNMEGYWYAAHPIRALYYPPDNLGFRISSVPQWHDGNLQLSGGLGEPSRTKILTPVVLNCIDKTKKLCWNFILFFDTDMSLTHWGRNEMDTISQTILSYVFVSTKMIELRLKFHRSLFLRVKYSIIGSDNGLATSRRQSIIWTNYG